MNLFFISLCIRNTIEYVLGSCGLTVIDIEVLNGGEDALDAFATLTWTPADAFSFIKVLSSSVVDGFGKINDGTPIVVSCSSSPFVLSIVNSDDTTAASVGAVGGGVAAAIDNGVACQLGNSLILPALRSVSFSVYLKPTLRQQNKVEDAATATISLKLSSSNPDEAGHEADNQANLSLPVRIKTNLYVAGYLI